MKLQLKRRGASLLLALALLCGLYAPARAAQSSLADAMQGSAAYLLDAVKSPQVGAVGGEWAVLGLARSGCAVPQSYWDGYYAAVEEAVTACQGVLHARRYSEYSRLILALTAIGADPTNVAGYDLLVPLGDYDKTIWQGLNGPIWALIALDSGNYDMPENPDAATQATRQMYLEHILSCELSGGGWALSSQGGEGEADADVTGMALQALAKYQDQHAVKAATDRALACMSAAQGSDGGFSSLGSATVESCVQMLVALCELGISLDEGRFVKNGSSILDALLRYRLSDGSFAHDAGSRTSNQTASEQGLYALAAASRAAEGRASLYRMEDVSISLSAAGTAAGLPGKSEAVAPLPVTVPGASFDDITAHANQAAIEALAARGIVNGKDSVSFDPDASMTRAEFAAIVVRALGLVPQTGDAFSDVPPDRWYAPFIGAAYAYKLIEGKQPGLFDPEGTITRQEAATLVARAAKLCGMDTQLADNEILNVLAQFSDYITVAQWARAGVAFCYREDILDQADLAVAPEQAILRCEIAQMVYNLLRSARLL